MRSLYERDAPGALSVGLTYSRHSSPAREPDHGTMACSVLLHREPTGMAGLVGLAEADVLGTFHVGIDMCGDRAGCGVSDWITTRFAPRD